MGSMQNGLSAALIVIALLTMGHAPLTPAAISVEQFRATPPTQKIARVSGYVIELYLCPPCPPHALCKPCMSPSSVVIADVPTRPGLPVQSTLRLETDMPDRFKKGAQYVFTIELLDPDAFTVGRVLEATQPQ